jgi:hypothetical protein
MQEKRFLIAGYFCLLLLLFFSIYFNVERLYGDSAYYLFRIINDRKFIIEHHRPIGVIIQVLPYLLSRSSASMSTIILSFSLNEWMYIAASFVVIAVVLKKPTAAFAMLFAYVAGSRWNYFNPVSELILSTPLYFIFYSLLEKGSGKITMTFIVFLLVLLIFNHPLNSIIVPVLLIMYWAWHKSEYKKLLFPFIILAAAILAHYFVLDYYERNPMEQHGKDYHPLSYLIKFNYARFWSKTLPWNLGTLVLFGLSFFYLWKQRKRILLLFSFLFAAAYFSLVMYSSSFLFPHTYEPFERYLFLLPVFSSALFFLCCRQENIYARHIVPFLLLAYHLGLNFSYGQFVKDRYVYFENAIAYAQQFPEQKMAFRNTNYYPKPKGQDWEMPNESLLLSARNGKVRQVFIREAFTNDMLSNLADNQFFYSPSSYGDMVRTNKKYFPLASSKIRYANTDADQSNYPDTFFKNITIEVDTSAKYGVGKEILIPVILHNNNSEPLTSGMGSARVALSYHWFREGTALPWDTIQTPLLADVYTEVNQEMILRTPKEKGKYELQADIVYNESKWVGIKTNLKNKITIE